ncbi:MAG TPA: fluoride efflux transporter CrcB [Acidimicrobiales bacterium]|nr:fluoride efflux transporter CrcB [Acidimicrobiales bacterium]
MSATVLAGLAAAGAVGAPARHLLDGVVHDRVPGPIPWGILVVNVTGSLVLGLVSGAALYHALPETPRIVLGTGFCGAFTTFSTFTVETIRLLEDGAVPAGCLNAAVSLVACAAAAAAGLVVAAAL